MSAHIEFEKLTGLRNRILEKMDKVEVFGTSDFQQRTTALGNFFVVTMGAETAEHCFKKKSGRRIPNSIAVNTLQGEFP